MRTYRVNVQGTGGDRPVDRSEGTVALIEWPERAPDALPADRIDIASVIVRHSIERRAAEITGHGRAARASRKLKTLRQFLDGARLCRRSASACPAMPRRVPMRGWSVMMAS